MNTIKINVRKNSLTFDFSSLNFNDTLNALLNAILAAANQTVLNAPAEQQPQLREALFHAMNQQFSTLLASFDPETDMRPDLTAEAMLDAELNYLSKQ